MIAFTFVAKLNKYQSNLSSTYVANGSKFSVKYADGYQSDGVYSQDTVSFLSFQIQNQSFGETLLFDTMREFEIDVI